MSRVRRPSREQVRRRLLDSAYDCLAELGWEEATLAKIADRAGFSTGAVYSNFRDKDDLVMALLEETVQTRIGRWVDVLLAQASHDMGLREGAKVMAALTENDRTWYLMLCEFWLQAARKPDAARRFRQHRDRVHEILRAALEKGAEQWGVALPLPASRLAPLLLAVNNGLAIEHLADPEHVPVSLFDDALRLLWPGGEAHRHG
jgi:AcrR family transcriptional regulator